MNVKGSGSILSVARRFSDELCPCDDS